MKRKNALKTIAMLTLAIAGVAVARSYQKQSNEPASRANNGEDKAKDDTHYVMDAFRQEIMGVDVTAWTEGDVIHQETTSAALLAEDILSEVRDILTNAGKNIKMKLYCSEYPQIMFVQNKQTIATVRSDGFYEKIKDSGDPISFRRAIEADIALRNRMKEVAAILSTATNADITYQDVYPYNYILLGDNITIEHALAQKLQEQYDWDESDPRTPSVQICQKLQNMYKKTHPNAVKQWKHLHDKWL